MLHCYTTTKTTKKKLEFHQKNDSQIEMVLPNKKQDSSEESFFIFEYLCYNVQ